MEHLLNTETESGTILALRELTFLQNLSSMKCLTSTLSTRGGQRKSHPGPNQEYVHGRNSWPFPAAIMGALGLQHENWERKMQNSAAGTTLPTSGVKADILAWT